MLNIPSTVVDNNYRYRMPKMQLKIESKGNGIKTNIVNLQDVAKHLRTNQGYILKFFGFEKASQTIEKSSETKSNKTAKTNTSYIIQGQFSDGELLKVLDKFIEKYILCPKCKLPQLNMFISGERIQGKCDSCPFNGELDNKHKLAAYILKNPPSYKPQVIKASKVIGKETKVEDKQEKKENSGKVENGEKQIQQSSTQILAKKEEKVQEEASEIFSAETIEFGSEQLQRLVDYTRKYIESRKDQDFDISCAETVSNLKKLGLKKTLLAYVIFNSLFTVNLVKQLTQNSNMYLKLMRRLVSASEESIQTETLLNIQYLFLQINKERDFTKSMPTIMYRVHENKLLSTKLLIKWTHGQITDLDKFFLYNEARNDQMVKISKQFVESLEEDDDEENEI